MDNETKKNQEEEVIQVLGNHTLGNVQNKASQDASKKEEKESLPKGLQEDNKAEDKKPDKPEQEASKEKKAEEDKKEAPGEKKAEEDKKGTPEEKKAEEDKKEAPEEKKAEEDKKEAPGEKKAEEDKKEASKEKKAEEVKKESSEEKKEDKKEAPEEKKAEDDKKEASKEKKTEEAEKKSSEDEKDEKTSNNAISQSKRLADAKALSNQPEEKTGKKNKAGKTSASKSKKGIGITFGVIFGLLLVAYIGGFVYFSNFFYPDVAVNGIDISGKNEVNAKATVDAFYQDYILTIDTIDDKHYPIIGKEIDMQITLLEDMKACLKKQNAYLWFVNIFEHHDYTIEADTSWNQEKLEQKVAELKLLDSSNMIAPEDAYIGFINGDLTIVKEVMGTTLDKERFTNALLNSLETVQSNLDLYGSQCYKLPAVHDKDEELKAEYDAICEFASNEIKIQMDDLLLEPQLELYDAVLEKKGDVYQISRNKVDAYVADLANQYDTLGTERTFSTSFNDRKIQIYGTAFGYELNQEETADALYAALTSGKPQTVEAVFNNKGYTLQGENDIGDTYIEVNLSEQKVVAYKDGRKIAEDDCVSGNESAGNGTCTGLYAIQDKLSPTVLRGEKVEVEKTVVKKTKSGKKKKVKEKTMEYSYESPVTYWLQFNGGIGLHDAAGWRSVYGGSIYYYSGSHGCVNLPLKFAETLYKNFEVGDPVIVYFWDNENRK